MDKREVATTILSVAVLINERTTTLPLPLTLDGSVIGTNGIVTLYTLAPDSKIGISAGTAQIPTLVVPNTVRPQTIIAGGIPGNQSRTLVSLAVQRQTTSNVTTPADKPFTATPGSSAITTGGSNTATSSSSDTAVSATLAGNQLLWTDLNNKTHKIPAYPKGGLQPDGKAAGLAIGCLLAGAIIVGLVCFCLFSRRNKRQAAQNAHYESPTYVDEHHLKHHTTVNTAPAGAIGAASIIEDHLPQPKEDNAIIGDLSRIKSRIEGHVDSYYHTAGTNNKAVAQALSDALGAGFPISTSKIQELLSNPWKLPEVLRAAIAWIIVSRIDGNSDPAVTFLPAHLAGASRDLTASKMDETSRVAFFSKWRQITAVLSGNTFLQDINADDSRLANIRGALGLADTFLRPYAKDADHDKRLFNLEEIMKRAARFGFVLFSQPSSFQFDWIDSESGLVVFPGLLQVSDDNGKSLPSPRAFGQKEVVPI